MSETFEVVDGFGVSRRVAVDADDPSLLRGEIEVEGEPMRFWLPRGSVREPDLLDD